MDVPLSLDLSGPLLGDGRAHRRADGRGTGHARRRAGARRRRRADERTVLGFVGSNPTTRPLIEASFKRMLEILDAHLAARPYLLGGRPAMADFGLWGQLYEAATDPTPGALMRASSPNVMAWVQRMNVAQGGGRVRGLGVPVGRFDAAAHRGGRTALPALVHRQRGVDREGREELFDVTLCGIELDTGAAEVSRPFAAGSTAASTPPPRAPPGSTISSRKPGPPRRPSQPRGERLFERSACVSVPLAHAHERAGRSRSGRA